MKTIDCRGLACPAPVLTAKQALEAENPNKLTVVVDNEAARQNVTRFLESQKFQVSVEARGEEFLVTGQIQRLLLRMTHRSRNRTSTRKRSWSW